ncbi:hypothetical protein KS888_000901 [Escherichia coli]|uniref:hypothetical protein n=1 Tax=Citrobacter portucalensis TaxID=1639133 RepID=UPI0029FB2D5C|nr:hypothetical protein [Escherichia coli]
MKKCICFMAALLLAGCSAGQQREARLNNIPSLKTQYNGQREYLKEYSAKIKTNKTPLEKVKICVLRNVSNRDVILSDASKSFVGAYTGNYYNIGSKTVVNGGGVVESVGDAGAIIVQGNTSYSFDSGIVQIKRVVRFTLDAIPRSEQIDLTFSNIQQAQTETGAFPNTGFFDIGTWEGAGPYQAIMSLDNIVSSISECIK